MNSITYVVSDSVTMLRRILVHMQRNLGVTILATFGTPILVMVMMYNMFGGIVQQTGSMSAGTTYIDFMTPGLILITAIQGMGMATMRANTDMTKGIIARFRTMSITRSSVLNGHVLGSAIGTLLSIGIVVGLAILTGFRPTTNVLGLLAAFGLIVLVVVSTTWLAVGVGVASKSPDAANSTLFLLYILPFLSSAFIPTASMTPVLGWIAENQPFSPIIDTIRALLLGTPVGSRGLVAVGWCVLFAVVGYVWARVAYNRNANT